MKAFGMRLSITKSQVKGNGRFNNFATDLTLVEEIEKSGFWPNWEKGIYVSQTGYKKRQQSLLAQKSYDFHPSSPLGMGQ